MSLIGELRRRNVFRVAAAYLVFGWLVLQIGDVLFPALRLPAWTMTLIAVLLGIGFVAVLIFSWVFELTPEGIKRETEVDRSQSITRETGRKLDVVTIVMVALAAGLLLADRFFLRDADKEDAVPVPVKIPEAEPEANGTHDDPIPVLAVLPFKATGSDDSGFLSAGLHDDLLTRLARLKAFKVISRTSMMEYADTTKNMRQIGQELGADYIVEGGVQARGSRVRINAQLIDAAADEHVWAEIYDRELTADDLFDVQAEISTAIAQQTRAILSEAERAIISEVPTHSTEAYSAYLRGLELRDTGGLNDDNVRLAIAAFEEAVAADPGFAAAWANLSAERSRLSQITGDPAIGDAALQAYDKAREIRADAQEAGLAWATYLYRVQLEYEKALLVLEQLSEQYTLDAQSLTLQGYLLRRVGRYRDAYGVFLEASEIDPRSVEVARTLVRLAVELNDCDAATGHVKEALDLAAGSSRVAYDVAKYELDCTGDARRALEVMRGTDLAAPWDLRRAMEAAYLARNYEALMHLIDKSPRGADPRLELVRDSLWRADAYRSMGRPDDAVSSLSQAGEALQALEHANTPGETASVAGALSWYYAMKGDADATRYWVREYKTRSRLERKGDRAEEDFSRFSHAYAFAMAGLYDEAVAELRTMLENPGGRSFRYVDGWPAFEAMRDHPGYVELRERFGEAR